MLLLWYMVITERFIASVCTCGSVKIKSKERFLTRRRLGKAAPVSQTNFAFSQAAPRGLN